MVLSKKQITVYLVILGLFIFLSGTLFGFIIIKKYVKPNVVLKTEPFVVESQNDTEVESNSLNKSAQVAIPCVVNISSDDQEGEGSNFLNFDTGLIKRFARKEVSLGSGIVVAANGYILTNYHVIEKKHNLKVSLWDKRQYWAKVVGTDPKSDIAVLKINVNNLPTIKIANSDKSRVGDFTLAVGNPFGLGETVTMGIISAIGRSNIGLVDYENFIQTDAAVNPGNSGGALVNLKGELIGINTAIVTKSGGYEGIGFAIPSNMAKQIFENIISYKQVKRGWIGIAIQELNSDISKKTSYHGLDGVIVIEVVSGGPAMKSGLRKGDIITRLNGLKIKDKGQLRNLVAQSEIGKQIALTIFRGGQNRLLSVKISELPNNHNLLGLKDYKFPAK